MDRSAVFLKQQGVGQKWIKSARLQLEPTLKSLRTPVLVAIAYYLGAQAAFSIGTLSDRIIAPFWPPNVILFCGLLIAPKRQWLWYVAAAFPAHLLAEMTVSMPLAQSVVAFTTNCIVAVLSALGVRRFLQEPPWFGTLRQTAVYIFITAGVSPAISAFGGAFVQIIGGGSIHDYWTYWSNWYLANALGSITLGPLFLIWFSSRPQDEPRFTFARKTEAIVLTLSLVTVCGIAFHVGARTVTTGFLPAVLYSPVPVILWAAIRFGEKGSTGAILVMTVVAIWENLRASTVFEGVDAGTSVLALQIFLLGIDVPIFFLGTAIDELRRSGEATRKLAGALLKAQDEERRRIARELHDSTGQSLAMAHLMAMQVQTLVPPGDGHVIGELKDILQGVMSEIRTVSYLLHPPLLDVGGLRLALQSYIDGFSKRTGISVDLNVSPNLGRIASDVELVLFRVIQEALTNVWRHSGSSTARIQLLRQGPEVGRQIILSIEDSGKGIPRDIHLPTRSKSSSKRRAPSGVGLMGMSERLRQVGGRLEIDSTSGKTVIRAIVTLNEESKAEGT